MHKSSVVLVIQSKNMH